MPIDGIAEGARLVLESPQAIHLLWLAPLLLWPVVGRGGRRPGPAAAVLRLIALAAIVLCAAGLAIEREVAADRLCVVVATDLSESDAEAAAALGEDWTGRLVRGLNVQDSLGALVFARHAEIVAWPASPPRPPARVPVTVDPSATRLSAGIESSLTLCPDGSERKVLLVSDGNETLGDARRAAELARQMGVRLYAAVPSTDGKQSVAIEKVLAPPLVREGSAFPLRVILRNSGEQPMRVALELAVEGTPAFADDLEVDPGLNVIEVPRQMSERGTYRISARITAPDGRVDEKGDLSISVAGPIRALVVTEQKSSALARALSVKDVELEFRKPGEIPDLTKLVDFHCVVLDDVPRAALRPGALEALETYVRKFGGGLIATGGTRSFGDKTYQKSALERVLPVSFIEQKPRPKERKPLGMFLVVDRSNSMTYSGSQRDVRDGEKMRYAKQAARALIDQLDEDDHVGVIAFDAEPYVIGGLRPLKDHRAQLLDRIDRLLPGGGTDFKEALEIAGAQLAADDLRVRHIILLTDGDSNRGAADHLPLIRTLSSIGISVTTLRIGLDDVNLEFLQQISKMTNGRFYHVQKLDELPQLLVRDAERAETGPEGKPPEKPDDGERPPTLGEPSEVMRGFSAADFPTILDPVKSQAKSGADVLLSVLGDGPQPLLATWQVGLGRTAAFPLDPEGPSGGRWVSWPGYAKLWSQLVRWAIREQAPWETRSSVHNVGDRQMLEVETLTEDVAGTIVAEVMVAPSKSVPVTLTPAEPRIFRAPLPPIPPGRYPVTLVRRQGDRVLSQSGDVIVVSATTAERGTSAELARNRPDVDLLRDVTARTGGAVDPDVATMLDRRQRTSSTRQSLGIWLLPLALGCLLGDVALRQRRR